MAADRQPDVGPPGLARPRRFRPRLHYELLVCELRGHELVGTDARDLREQDRIFARGSGAVRWYRCLRCDSWLALPQPKAPAREHPPERDAIELPLRGRPLRDQVVLRVIAVDRALHFLVLGLLSVAVFVLAANRDALRTEFYRVLADIQGGVSYTGRPRQHGLLGEIGKLLSLRSGTLRIVGAALATYAIVEGVEAVGLWFQKRWAEYLTFVVTTSLLPVEIYELTRTVTPFKVVALVVNLAIVIYLLVAKRLFGVRGGAEADRAVRAQDVGWHALERAARGRGGVTGRGVKQLEDCKRKVRYATEREADDAAYRKRMEEGVRLGVYQCPWCGGWHLTRRRAE